MKIYISEKDMPKNKDFKCKGCEFIEHISATQKVCKPTGTHGHGNNGDCPLQSLEQHDNEVRREFAEKLKDKMPKLDEGETMYLHGTETEIAEKAKEN